MFALPTTPAGTAFPSGGAFGKFGSTAAVLGTPLGGGRARITRGVPSHDIRFDPPPGGQGDDRWKWDPQPDGHTYTLTADTADLIAARPLREWRKALPLDLTGAAVADRKSDGVRRLDRFAHRLLDLVAHLHACQWRLGLTDPDNLYVVERGDAVHLLLPDLGFAWVGSVSEARPRWLRSAPYSDDDPLAVQLAAPAQYGKRHPAYQRPGATPDGVWATFVRQDLRLAARLVHHAASGANPPAAEPPAARDPLWAVLRTAEADGFATATQLRDAARSALAPRGVVINSDGKVKKRGNRWLGPTLVAGVLVGAVGAAAAAGWWYFLRDAAPQLDLGFPDSVRLADGSGGGELRFTVGDDKTPPGELAVAAESSNHAVLPPAGIRLGGSGADRVVGLTPAGPGAAEVTLTVTDAGGRSASRTFRAEYAGPKGVPPPEPVPDGPLAAVLRRLDTTPPVRLEGERRAALDAWRAAVEEASRLAEEPARQGQATAALAALRDQLARLAARPSTDPAQQEKEKQCLAYITELARQYGAPSRAP